MEHYSSSDRVTDAYQLSNSDPSFYFTGQGAKDEDTGEVFKALKS